MNQIAKANIAKAKLGNKNPIWKGDKVGYPGIHAFIRRHKPKPAACEICYKITRLDLANCHPSGEYTRNINDYRYICRKCHMTTDGRINRFYNSKLQSEIGKALKKTRVVRKRQLITTIRSSD